MSKVSTINSSSVAFESADALVREALRAAIAVDVAASAVVVDRTGEIVAAGRGDSASVLSLEVASRKAWTAANVGASTADLAQHVASDSAAVVYMQSIPRFVAIPGGLPIQVEGTCVGAIGVSGGSSEQDADIAAAALEAIGNMADV
jgi:uncharacterized protein GlcG (DUF336 family)